MNASDMVRIAQRVDDEDRRHALALITNVGQAERALAAYKAPMLGARFADDAHDYDHPADAGTELVCPWCGKDAEVYAHDRGNDRESGVETADMATEVIQFNYGDDHPDWGDTIYYSTGCCELPVSLPEGWEEV